MARSRPHLLSESETSESRRLKGTHTDEGFAIYPCCSGHETCRSSHQFPCGLSTNNADLPSWTGGAWAFAISIIPG